MAIVISDLSTFDLTDERLARRIASDFPVLTARNEFLANGTDGAFDPSDRWTLASASTIFDGATPGGQGVAPSNLCILDVPGAKTSSTSSITATLYAVAAVSGHSMTLRRPNLTTGVGTPPGPAAGGTGYSFRVWTLRPQIEAAAAWTAARYGLTGIADPTTAAILKPELLQEIAYLTACAFCYGMQTRQAAGPVMDDLAAQRKNYLEERDQLVLIADAAYGIYPEEEKLLVGPLSATRFAARRRRACGPELGTPREW